MAKNEEKVTIHHRKMGPGGANGAIYGLGFVGAVIYFIVHATSFWVGVLGVLKAIVWPAFVVYYLFEFLKL